MIKVVNLVHQIGFGLDFRTKNSQDQKVSN